jgi:protein CpxP
MTTLLTLRKHTLVALAILGMGAATLPAQAQTSAAAGPATHATHAGEHGAKHGKHGGPKLSPEQRRAKWAARAAARQQQLREALALTPAQQGAWTNYQAALAPQARGARPKLERAAPAATPAPERMAQRLQMAQQRVAAMQARLNATSTFYSVLSADQKKAFDAAATGPGRRGHAGHRVHRLHGDSAKPAHG